MMSYTVLIVVCGFCGLNPKQLLQCEDIGYRWGFIGVAQLPLGICFLESVISLDA